MNNSGLLSGIHILDLADETAWFCGRLLADLGATVTRVEKPAGNAGFRRTASDRNERIETSLRYRYNNANKLGITLDIEQEQGRKIFLKLAKTVDGIIETYPPGYLEKLGLSYGLLSAQNANLVMASITGFGQTGPRRQWSSCNLIASASGGQMYVCGDTNTPPLAPYGQQAYSAASLFAAIGILIALRARHNINRGQHIDISIQEAAAASVEHIFLRYFRDDIVAQRQGNVHWNNAASIFRCKDGFMLITFNREWEILTDLLDSEDMAADLKEKRWLDEQYRTDHIDHIIETISRWTINHTTGEIFDTGQALRFPWAPVASPLDILSNPQLQARGFFTSALNPETEQPCFFPGIPFTLPGHMHPAIEPAPLPGQHNDLVFRKRLCLSDIDIQNLRDEGVI